MRRIIGIIGATLAIVVVMATSTAPAGASPLPGGSKTFVGPADDAFFVDLGSVFDGVNIDKPGR